MIPNVLRDCPLRICSTHRVDEVSARPECPAPELLLHLRVEREYFSHRNTFYRLDDPRGQEHGYRLDEKVDVVFVGAYLKKMHVVPLFNLQACIPNSLIYQVGYDYSPILCWTDNMVEQTTYVVAFVEIETHAYRIPFFPQQAAGYLP